MASIPVKRFCFSWLRRIIKGRPYSSKATVPGIAVILFQKNLDFTFKVVVTKRFINLQTYVSLSSKLHDHFVAHNGCS